MVTEGRLELGERIGVGVGPKTFIARGKRGLVQPAVKNVPNNNGRVGQWGISWAGWEVSQGMIDAHPAPVVTGNTSALNKPCSQAAAAR